MMITPDMVPTTPHSPLPGDLAEELGVRFPRGIETSELALNEALDQGLDVVRLLRYVDTDFTGDLHGRDRNARSVVLGYVGGMLAKVTVLVGKHNPAPIGKFSFVWELNCYGSIDTKMVYRADHETGSIKFLPAGYAVSVEAGGVTRVRSTERSLHDAYMRLMKEGLLL